MTWWRELFLDRESTLTAILILSVVIAFGLTLGSLRFRGVRFGVAGVLFAGLILGHFGFSANPAVLDFAREFGLILFVYAVGLSVGPGFFNALRAAGLKLNLLAAGGVLLGALLSLGYVVAGWVDVPVAAGMFSGATTNTPSLGAANQALREHPVSAERAQATLAHAIPDQPVLEGETLTRELAKLPGLGYAIAYPFGTIGAILVLIALRGWFRVDLAVESEKLQREALSKISPLHRLNLRVTNPNLAGRTIERIPALESLPVSISRVMRDGQVTVASPDFVLAVGDYLLAVGPPDALEEIRTIVGEKADVDLMSAPSTIAFRWVVVSKRKAVGERIEELQLDDRYGVQVTRVRRSEIEFPAHSDVRLGLGDQVLVVGMPDAVAAVARELGDSDKQLQHPDLIPVFVGIVLGILLGSIPFVLPGIGTTVKLGLACGPLIVALLVSRVQRIGPLVFFLPGSASYFMREFGIALFLATVGLRSGDRFMELITSSNGIMWMFLAALITAIPLIIIGWIAWRMGLNYLTIMGVLAGCHTSPSALAFANMQAGSEAPALAYATVYPLTMILRVLVAQLMIVVWCG